MQLSVAAQLPLKIELEDLGKELRVEPHNEIPSVTEDSTMAKVPAGTTEDPAMVEEVGLEDELEDITSVIGRNLDLPVRCSRVNVDYSRSVGPRPDSSLHLLSALREMMFSGTLDVYRAFFSDPKVDAVGEAAPTNSISLRGGQAGGDVDPVETPDLVTEDEARPGAGGNLPRRDSARNGRESQEVLESTQAATALEGGRALASSAATNAGACGSAFTAGACGSAPVRGIFASHCRLLRQRLQRTRGHQRRH
eukprot:s7924_g1.t1